MDVEEKHKLLYYLGIERDWIPISVTINCCGPYFSFSRNNKIIHIFMDVIMENLTLVRGRNFNQISKIKSANYLIEYIKNKIPEILNDVTIEITYDGKKIVVLKYL